MRLSLLLAAALLPAAAIAHHGWSTYDPDKSLTVSGKLTDLRWANPHVSAKLAYQRKVWNVVLAPVPRMEARGLTLAMLQAGQPVTLAGQPRKDGTAEIKIEQLTLDGKTYELR
jgi:hypothetical protein